MHMNSTLDTYLHDFQAKCQGVADGIMLVSSGGLMLASVLHKSMTIDCEGCLAALSAALLNLSLKFAQLLQKGDVKYILVKIEHQLDQYSDLLDWPLYIWLFPVGDRAIFTCFYRINERFPFPIGDAQTIIARILALLEAKDPDS
jgi:predicted regulator of Ras-like GTPase activity (Roadblock/LC7/MglB family)